MERHLPDFLSLVLVLAGTLGFLVCCLRVWKTPPLFDDRHLNHRATYDHYDHEERETRSGVIVMSDSNRDRPEHLDRDDSDEDCRGEARPPGRRNRDREPRERKRRQRPTPRPGHPQKALIPPGCRKCDACPKVTPDVLWDRWTRANLCKSCWAAIRAEDTGGPKDGMVVVEEMTERARERRAQGGNG